MISTNKQIATYYILSEALNKQMAMNYMEERCKFESNNNLDILHKAMPEYIAGWVVDKVDALAYKMSLNMDAPPSPSELHNEFGHWYKEGQSL